VCSRHANVTSSYKSRIVHTTFEIDINCIYDDDYNNNKSALSSDTVLCRMRLETNLLY